MIEERKSPGERIFSAVAAYSAFYFAHAVYAVRNSGDKIALILVAALLAVAGLVFVFGVFGDE